MNTMSKLTLAAAATAALGGAATSTAYAGSNINGPRLTGVALESLEVRPPGGHHGELPLRRHGRVAPAGHASR